MEKIQFVADVNVGKLARWLRVLGFDVVYSNTLEDDEIVRIAEAEDRIILTRDAGLTSHCQGQRNLLIESNYYKEQLRQVLRTFGLKEFSVFSRCLECNTLLIDVDKETVFERIPPFVYLTQDRFAACPSCNRVYWRGTHSAEMLARIAEYTTI